MWLTFEELEARSADFDARIAETPEIDAFCSSTDWILPARAAFSPSSEPLVLALDGGGTAAGGYVALMAVTLEQGAKAAFPIEASWGLASPLAGPRPERLLAALDEALATPLAGTPAPQLVVLSGLAVGGQAFNALTRRRGRGLRLGPTALRIVADLSGGVDAFLARRTAKFRATTRRARRAAAASGVEYERLLAADLADPAALERAWQRCLAVERRCWKAGAELGGIDQGPMHEFYRLMCPRVARRGGLRMVFARRDGVDLAYCFGGLFGRAYRGLQASFDDAFAHESPGVLVHLEMIELLCAEGVTSYDLGSDMEYKRRWGEPGLETVACVLVTGRSPL